VGSVMGSVLARAVQPGPPLAADAPSRGGGIPSPIERYLHRLHERYVELRSGEVATYIPELGKADPEWFGVCLATTDGRLYEVGETRQAFTIQSISKPLTYGLALEDRGTEAVLEKVGVEPSGDAFNSISLDPHSGCPLNPMINAGAIATAGLVAGRSAEDRLERLLSVYSLYAGRRLTIDDAVYRSEKETGHRNRAIGHMLRNFDVLTEHPDDALDLYFQQCSILVDCRDLAVMAATLANGGTNPVTGARAIRHELVPSILSVMTTCGMYDFAGEWVYAVGMPAKSGVGGGILAVLPGQLGIGVFSPRLDARGNSVRGVAVCKEISRDFSLHFLRVPSSAHVTIRGDYDLTQLYSRRLRSDADRAVLERMRDRARTYVLQGDLSFAAVEAFARRVVEASATVDLMVVDLKRVTEVETCAVTVVARLLAELGPLGKQMVFVANQEHSAFLRALQLELASSEQGGELKSFSDRDPALEWCENRLLATVAPTNGVRSVSLAEHEMCAGFDAKALATLKEMLEPRRYPQGTTIFRQGDRAEEVFLLMSGNVSVIVEMPNGEVRRLSTVSPGMVFGELTVVDRTARTADVHADTAVECLVLPAAALDRMSATHPTLKMAILENLLRNVHQTVGRLDRQVTALST
jgi:glutaminase